MVSSHDSAGINGINSSSTAGRFSCLFDRHSGKGIRPQKVAQRKNLKEQPTTNRLAHYARTRGLASWVMQWVCSLRDSLQGEGVRLTLPRPTLRTGFPLPTWGRPQRPPGGSTAHLQLFKNSTGHSLMQIANRLISCVLSRLFELISGPGIVQPATPCGKAPVSVGNAFQAQESGANQVADLSLRAETRANDALRGGARAVSMHKERLLWAEVQERGSRTRNKPQICQPIHKKLHC